MSHSAQSQKSLTHLHAPSSWPELLRLSVRQLWHTVTAFLGYLFAVLSTLYETELGALLLQYQHSPAARHVHHFDQCHLQRCKLHLESGASSHTADMLLHNRLIDGAACPFDPLRIWCQHVAVL